MFVPPPRPPYRSHVVVPRVLTPAQCDRVVALGADRPPEPAALVGDPATTADTGLRRSRVTWIPPEGPTAWLFERLAAVVERANRQWGFELTGFGEDLQLTTYDEPGAFYTWHQDGLDADVATRKLAVVVQLTDPDDYDGADLQLFEVVADLHDDELAEWTASCRARGTAVVFPAFEYHRVTPLRAGVRHSLVAWVSGPPFR